MALASSNVTFAVFAVFALFACSGEGANAVSTGAGFSGSASSSGGSGGTGDAESGSAGAVSIARGGARNSDGGGALGSAGVAGTAAGVTMTNGFVHPGVLLSRGMLDFVKQKIAAGAAPWKTALARAASDTLGSLPYTPHPTETVECGTYANPDLGCGDERQDADAAYTEALLWYYTGERAYADSAINVMNVWAITIRAHTSTNAQLQAAWVAAVFARAAEIMRYSNAGWADADIDAFATMLTTVYLPEIANGSADNGDWDLSMSEAMIAIGVFTNDQDVFATGIDSWQKRVPAYIYLSSDGATPVPPPKGAHLGADLVRYWYDQTVLVDGLSQETCRDLSHVQYGLAAMINAAETASIQGLDLIGTEQKRISAALEFHAQYLNGASVPAWLCKGVLTAATAEPMWEIGYNQYATTLGMSLPSTQKLLLKMRPTAADRHMVWETLSHADIGGVGLPGSE